MNNYYNETNEKAKQKWLEIYKLFPQFARYYFDAIAIDNTARTMQAYAYDLRIFFNYLLEAIPDLENKKMCDIKLENLAALTSHDIESFLTYLTSYEYNNKYYSNNKRGIARKISCIGAMYHYLVLNDYLEINPFDKIRRPREKKEKNIMFLEADEAMALMNGIKSADSKLTKKETDFYKKSSLRDLAIVTLILNTGIRVSECVGLDIRDVDLQNDCIYIIRKGGKKDRVYFNQMTHDVLTDYIECQRKILAPLAGHENALFLSIQKKRLSVRSIEIMVKKYMTLFGPATKNITVHKLRASYGTQLYRETGDIMLCSEVLGHSSPSTTARYYVDSGQKGKQVKNMNVYSSNSEE